MRGTLREHGIEPQSASEFSTREEGCWLLTGDQFAGMECRVVVVVDDGGYDINALCRCTSYLVYVSIIGSIRTRSKQIRGNINEQIKQSTAVQLINPYPASTPQHREVQDFIDE